MRSWTGWSRGCLRWARSADPRKERAGNLPQRACSRCEAHQINLKAIGTLSEPKALEGAQLAMNRLSRLAAFAAIALLLASCHPPTYASAYPDARNSGPFWEREEQRD